MKIQELIDNLKSKSEEDFSILCIHKIDYVFSALSPSADGVDSFIRNYVSLIKHCTKDILIFLFNFLKRNNKSYFLFNNFYDVLRIIKQLYSENEFKLVNDFIDIILNDFFDEFQIKSIDKQFMHDFLDFLSLKQSEYLFSKLKYVDFQLFYECFIQDCNPDTLNHRVKQILIFIEYALKESEELKKNKEISSLIRNLKVNVIISIVANLKKIVNLKHDFLEVFNRNFINYKISEIADFFNENDNFKSREIIYSLDLQSNIILRSPIGFGRFISNLRLLKLEIFLNPFFCYSLKIDQIFRTSHDIGIVIQDLEVNHMILVFSILPESLKKFYENPDHLGIVLNYLPDNYIENVMVWLLETIEINIAQPFFLARLLDKVSENKGKLIIECVSSKRNRELELALRDVKNIFVMFYHISLDKIEILFSGLEKIIQPCIPSSGFDDNLYFYFENDKKDKIKSEVKKLLCK